MRSVASLPAVDAELKLADASLKGSCGVLIPAYNEEATVRAIVEVAKAAELGPVLVVDDGSSDGTGSIAQNSGVNVLFLGENQGKGGAVFAGASALETDVVILVDADLTGLTPEHLRTLAQPVLKGKVDMTRGDFAGGRWRTTTAQRITPQLNGQRAILREKLLGVPGLKTSRYGIEIAITETAKRDNWRTQRVTLANVSQVMKEEKRGFIQGLQIRLGMYKDILETWLKNRLES